MASFFEIFSLFEAASLWDIFTVWGSLTVWDGLTVWGSITAWDSLTDRPPCCWKQPHSQLKAASQWEIASLCQAVSLFNWVEQIHFLHHQNLTWDLKWLRYGPNSQIASNWHFVTVANHYDKERKLKKISPNCHFSDILDMLLNKLFELSIFFSYFVQLCYH